MERTFSRTLDTVEALPELAIVASDTKVALATCDDLLAAVTSLKKNKTTVFVFDG